MALLQFENVSYVYDGKAILDDICVNIQPGEFISVVGPSGSGKSTFLKLCSNLISPTGGVVSYKEKNIWEYNPVELRKKIAYCFQTPYLFGDSVMENVAFPYSLRNSKPERNRINELFALFNLPIEILDTDVKNLSGGEKQRIALIRSLLFKPEVLLLDEATSALDTDNAQIVENVISTLNNDGMTILWVTHNLEQSRKYANRILTIETGRIKSTEVLK